MNAAKSILAACLLLILPLDSRGSESSPGQPRFTLKIAGGISSLELGDYNTDQRSENEARKDWTQRRGYGFSGGYEYIHHGLDIEAEACLYLVPRLAVVLGAGYIKAWRGPETNRQTVEWTAYQFTSDFSQDMRITAIPILLGLKYDFRLADKIGFFLKACVGYYFANYSRISREDQSGANKGYDWYTYQEDGRSSGFGFQGGLGFEYRLNRNLALVIEGCGRYAKIDGFNVDYKDAYSYGLSRSGSGTLYYYEYFDLEFNKWYPGIGVRKSAPSNDPTLRNVREAVFDFSGFALRAGIKISL